VGSLDLGIVLVMMIVRTPPDAAGTERIDAKTAHENLHDPRLGQNGVMLLVVIDDEQAKEKQSCENAEGQLGDKVGDKNCRCEGQNEKRGRGKNMPPTGHGTVHGVRLGRQDKVFARSYYSDLRAGGVRRSGLFDRVL